jgi:replicative DNA helicase
VTDDVLDLAAPGPLATQDHDERAGRRLRTPPQSPDAERAVLGAILLDNEALERVRDSVTADDFVVGSHRVIFEAMVDLAEKGDPLDELTVTQRLKETGLLERAGGLSGVSALANSIPTSAHAEAYARIVRECAVRRRIMQVATGIIESGLKGEGDVRAFVDKVEQEIFAVCEDPHRGKYQAIKDLLIPAMQRLEAAANRGEAITGVPTGFSRLDHMTAGLQPSDLVIVAGRPSMGKTAFTLNVASTAALKNKIPTLVFSLEMSGVQLANRLMGAEALVDLSLIRTGRLPTDAWTKLSMAVGRISEAPLYIDDSGVLNVFDVRTKCRRLKREAGLGLVIIDYLQLMSGGQNVDNRAQEISEISRGLKAVARELEVPVVALSQLNRSLESRTDKRPLLSDLRESGAIEQDADVIMFLYRDDYYNKESPKKGQAEIIIGKQRNGPTGTVELAFQPQYTRFTDLVEDA